MVEIKIEKTPKLGSMKETLGFMKDVAKELTKYQAALGKESIKFFFKSTKKGMQVNKIVKKVIKKGEGLLSSPDIVYHGEKYWVLRYGPQMFKVIPPKNLPTGYTVFTDKNKIVDDLNLSKRICKLYKIWEEFYIRPYKIVRSKKLLEWISSIREKIFEEISKRRLKAYEALDMEVDEKKALKELDDQVYDFHKTDVELTQLEEKLLDIRLSIFEYPSEENIENLIRITRRFNELFPDQNKYLERRISTWTKYRYLLEKKYKIKVNFDVNTTDLGFAAFVDLMKFVLFGHIIPEGVLIDFTWEATKSVAKAKITQAIMNLLIHFGGLESLKTQAIALASMEKGLKNYLNIWNTEISSDMVRVP